MNTTPPTETALMPRQSLPAMAEAYRTAVGEMREAFAKLTESMQRLDVAFGSGDYRCRGFCLRNTDRGHEVFEPDAERVELQWRQSAWRILVDRLELKRVCSVARAKEIDRQMENPKELPEITEANMLAMLEGNVSNIGAFLQEAVVELFDRLRPWHRGDLGDGYKTNKVYTIGERLVLSGYATASYGGGRFRVSFYEERSQTLRCLDNVMHLLDGKGTIPTHAGPLLEALNGDGNYGHVETEYFEAKCFKNCNLHLRFKRLDLLAELNLRGSQGAPQLPSGNRK
jgi:hypothetical protein